MRELLPKRADAATRDAPNTRICEGITKRSQVSIACGGCRRRKVKCDNRRPKCTACLSSNQECQFPMSRFRGRAINIEDLPYMGQRYQCLVTVLEMLRVAEGCELEDMLRQIRGAQSIDDYLDSVHEAALLLPLAGTARPTTNKQSSEEASSRARSDESDEATTNKDNHGRPWE